MKNHRIVLSRTKIRPTQQGMASIVITMVTMVVISLIVLGFATISRREQGQTLDQQLSTQAFYAAESGVEDAQNVIASAIKSGKAVPGKTDCSTNTDDAGYSPNYPTGVDTVLDSTHNVSYSCLLVNPSPSSLIYDGVSSSGVVVPMTASQSIDTIKITWTPTSGASGTPNSCPGSTSSSFSLQSKWSCGYALLRMDLVPTEGALTRSSLESSVLTGFFEPTNKSASGQLSYSGNAGQPHIVAANCDLSSYTQCTVTITGLSSDSYSLRMSSMYQPVDKLTIAPSHGGTPLNISGAQALVDVTGKASDVLRRIQVRLPVGATGIPPSFAIQSNGSLCKRFSVTPNYLNIPGDIQDPDTANNMCVQQTYGTLQSGG